MGDDKQLPEGIPHSELEPGAVDSANFHFRKPTSPLSNSDKKVESRAHRRVPRPGRATAKNIQRRAASEIGVCVALLQRNEISEFTIEGHTTGVITNADFSIGSKEQPIHNGASRDVPTEIKLFRIDADY